MVRLFGFLLVVVGIFGFFYHLFEYKVPEWKQSILVIMRDGEEAKMNLKKWENLIDYADQTLPSYYPFSKIHGLLEEGKNIVERSQKFIDDFDFVFDFEAREVSKDTWDSFFQLMEDQSKSLERILGYLYDVPLWALDAKEKRLLDSRKAELEIAAEGLEKIRKLKFILDQFVVDKERVLILLQNQNEPRSTGGFVGSLVLLDFSGKGFSWKFLDTYSLDRLLGEKGHIQAPLFFHDLSKVISLRDANFWPDFRDSAQQYRFFFDRLGEKNPETVIAINLGFFKEILKTQEEIVLKKWDLKLDAYNFDVILQFLVESKISGRYAVKDPILDFALALFGSFDWKRLERLNFEALLGNKNILAHSQNIGLQKLFESWGIDGQLKKKKDTDNFVHFDFVSIGANKSEKFVWTKLWHDSRIDSTGKILNTIKIKRTHALESGELDDLLGTNLWSKNLLDLLSDELRWKLGQGENRTVLRIWVPKNAEIVSFQSPSGPIKKSLSLKNRDFDIFEVPLFVLPGETVEATIEYETQLSRGSSRWRPYNFQLWGNSGKEKTTFLKTISTEKNGHFQAKTQNIGRMVELQDQDFLTIVTFDSKSD